MYKIEKIDSAGVGIAVPKTIPSKSGTTTPRPDPIITEVGTTVAYPIPVVLVVSHIYWGGGL